MLLARVCKFIVVPANVNENIDKSLSHRKYVENLAEKKARAVAKKATGVVIGADTMLICNGVKFGKPRDEKHAFEMLKKISGKKLYIYSGVAIVDSETDEKVVYSDKAAVILRKITEEETISYIKTKEPMDKAGAIAIQGIGRKFVSRVEGSRSTVIGLPIAGLRKHLRKFKAIK